MDSKKKRLWRARRAGAVPEFVLLTVESARWRAESRGVPWVEEVRRRRRCLRRYEEEQAVAPERAVGKLCREFGIQPRTLWRWRQRYREEGMAGLIPQSRRPGKSPRETPAWLEEAILTIRLRCGWGAERIAQELNHWGLGPVTHNAVWGVLRRRGKRVPLVRRSRKSGFRYQRETPNDLWHMDVKGPLHFRGVGPVYGMAILDDRSRFCVGAMLAPNRRMDTAISVLNGAVENWGAPRQLMSDNGSEFVGVGATAGDTRFLRRLDALEIEHLAIRLRTPETNGKIERFWLTLEQELLMRVEISSLTQGQEALLLWVAEYNFNRRHSALDYLTPAQVYCPEAGDPGVPGDLQAVMPYLLSLKEAHKDTL